MIALSKASVNFFCHKTIAYPKHSERCLGELCIAWVQLDEEGYGTCGLLSADLVEAEYKIKVKK